MSHRYNPDRHRRRSLRLKGYDYTRAGTYFVTIVVQGRSCLFGAVVNEEMRLNEAGHMVERVWATLPHRFPSTDVGEFVVMPNHIHGIIVIGDPWRPSPPANSVGASLVGALAPDGIMERATTRVAPTSGVQPTIGHVIGAYKSLTTVAYARGVNSNGWPPFHRRLWQRNYYEHIVRGEDWLTAIRLYIQNNPAQWTFDRENPSAVRPQLKLP